MLVDGMDRVILLEVLESFFPLGLWPECLEIQVQFGHAEYVRSGCLDSGTDLLVFVAMRVDW